MVIINIYGSSKSIRKNITTSLYNKLIKIIDKKDVINFKENGTIKIFKSENLNKVELINFYLYNSADVEPKNLPVDYVMCNMDLHSETSILTHMIISLNNNKMIRGFDI